VKDSKFSHVGAISLVHFNVRACKIFFSVTNFERTYREARKTANALAIVSGRFKFEVLKQCGPVLEITSRKKRGWVALYCG
jgi:hypothetical protein